MDDLGSPQSAKRPLMTSTPQSAAPAPGLSELKARLVRLQEQQSQTSDPTAIRDGLRIVVAIQWCCCPVEVCLRVTRPREHTTLDRNRTRE